jgi:anti-sigma regulatory factor (Ser/Thr protein kinase)
VKQSVQRTVGGEPRIALVQADGRLDRAGAVRLGDAVDRQLPADPDVIVLDVHLLTAATEEGLAVLVDLADRIRIWPGSRLVLSPLTAAVVDALRRSRWRDRLVTCPSVAAARLLERLPRLRRRLPATAEAAPLARHLVTDACRRWAVPCVSDLAELVTSELVGNAVRYAGRDIELSLSLGADELCIGVHDGNPRPPSVQSRVAPAAEHGRGLHLVATVARAWGSIPLGAGKVVWAAIALPA